MSIPAIGSVGFTPMVAPTLPTPPAAGVDDEVRLDALPRAEAYAGHDGDVRRGRDQTDDRVAGADVDPIVGLDGTAEHRLRHQPPRQQHRLAVDRGRSHLRKALEHRAPGARPAPALAAVAPQPCVEGGRA